jgi:hypothetical protein
MIKSWTTRSQQQSPAAYFTDGAGTRVDGQRSAIELDNDLPSVSPVPGLTGLIDLTVVNRAIGMLVDEGHDLEHAQHVLRGAAAAAQVAPHIYAAEVLRQRTPPS